MTVSPAISDPLVKNNVKVTGNLAAERTMVLVHGFGTDQTAWRDIMAPYLADYRVILLDNVGAGKSPPAAFVQHHYLDLLTCSTSVPCCRSNRRSWSAIRSAR